MVIVAAVPELVLILLAFAALMFVYLIGDIAKLIAAVLNGIPFIGGAVSDAIVGAVRGVTEFAQNAVSDQVQELTDMVDAVTGGIQWAIGSALDGVTSLWGVALDGFRALSGSVTFVQHQLQLIQADAQGIAGDVSRAFDKLAAQAATVAGIVAHVIPNAISAAVASVQHWAQGIVKDASRAIGDTVEGIRVAIRAFIVSQISSVTSLIQSIQADLQRRIDAAIRSASADLAAVETVIQGDITDLEHGLQHALDMVGPIAAGLTVAGLITAIQTAVRDIERCTDPMCSFLTPQLDALTAIEDVALWGAVLGLVGEAVNDPRGAARAAQQTLGPFVSEAGDLFASFTGRRVH